MVVSRIGYYTPFIIAGSIASAVATGLLTTLKPSSGAAAWVCYQLLVGVSSGMIRQQPITAVQAVIAKDQLSMAISIVTFFQMFGAALFISFGETAFTNSLKSSLEKYAPEINPRLILGAGATNFRSIVPASSLSGVILAYNRALTTTFVSSSLGHIAYISANLNKYISVGAACATFVASFGLKWINIKSQKEAGAGSPPKIEPQTEPKEEQRSEPENVV